MATQSPDVDLAAVAAPSQPAPPEAPPRFEDVYRLEFAYVWQTLRRLGVATRNLPDVTHDVFVTVFRRLDDYDPARPIKPWLFGIAFRVASDHGRLARNSRESVRDEIDPPDPAPSADERLEDAQRRAVVQAALLTLDLDRRAVLVAHDIDEQPIPEIARALGIPDKTLYSRLRVAREEFVAAVRRLQLRRGER